MITTVVFDLDDTLYDEIDYCRSGFASAASSIATLSDTYSSDRVFAALWKHFMAGNRTHAFNAALQELGITYDEKLIRTLVGIYRTHRPAISLPPETRSTLDELESRYTLALLTDGFLPAQKLKVQALGIQGYFKTLVYTEELGRQFWKPSPLGFTRLVEMLDVPPEQMAYVADNEMKDFIAPNGLGWLTIQLLRPARLHTDSCTLPNAPAKFTIREINELSAILAQT